MYSHFLVVLCLFLGLVSALPSPDRVLRQAPSVTVPTSLTSPTSITTTTTTVQTANGTMTETCVLTFTPMGQQIQEVKNCTLAMGDSQLSSTLLAVPSLTPTASPMVAAAFVLPGTTLLVLPVGLGVYGGITAIGLIVVAFVTWERVQSRRTYRKQRSAERTLLGYGGKGDGN